MTAAKVRHRITKSPPKAPSSYVCLVQLQLGGRIRSPYIRSRSAEAARSFFSWRNTIAAGSVIHCREDHWRHVST